jgi:hypothetical protein
MFTNWELYIDSAVWANANGNYHSDLGVPLEFAIEHSFLTGEAAQNGH